MIVMGVGIVGIVSNSQRTSSSVLGIGILMVAISFTAGQFVIEEKLLRGKDIDPFFMIGLEGLWGCLLFAILLPIFQNIDCHGPICHNGKIEDSLQAISDYQTHKTLILEACLNMITFAGFNLTGLIVTKNASAAQRSTIDTCRTLIVWLVFLSLGQEKFIFT